MSTNEILIWGIAVLTALVLLLMGPGVWSSQKETLLEVPLRWLKERKKKEQDERP